jgi:hypothetical protein
MVDFIVRWPHPSSDVRRAEILDALLICTHLRQRGLPELEAKLLAMANSAEIGAEELAPALGLHGRRSVEVRQRATAAHAAKAQPLRTYAPAVAPVRRKAREVWLDRYAKFVSELATALVAQWKSGAVAVSDMAEYWLDSLETDLAERRPTVYTVTQMMNGLAGLSNEFERRPPTGVEGKSLRALHTLVGQYQAVTEADAGGAERPA